MAAADTEATSSPATVHQQGGVRGDQHRLDRLAHQLDVDPGNSSAAQATVAAALASGRHDDVGIDPNVAGHQAFASPALTDSDSMQELVPADVAVTGPATYADKPPFPGELVGSPTLVAVTGHGRDGCGSLTH
jgi:hypothetical protein